VQGIPDGMIRFQSGEWYCPRHALLLVARQLVALYWAQGEANWTASSAILGETLPEVIAKVERGHLLTQGE